MTDENYPMTRVAANALVLATLVLAARLFAYAVAFVAGWRFGDDLMLLFVLATFAIAVGTLGTIVFGSALVVRTVQRRVHPRYVIALTVLVALWFVPFALPPPYLSGMTQSLRAADIDEAALVEFAAAARAQVAAAPPRVTHELRRELRALRNSQPRIVDRLPPDTRVVVDENDVYVWWGNRATGAYGIRVFDRGEPPAGAPDTMSTRERRYTPRVLLTQYHD